MTYAIAMYINKPSYVQENSIMDLRRCLYVTVQLFVMLKREWATVTCMGSGKEMDLRVEQKLKSVSNFTIIVF